MFVSLTEEMKDHPLIQTLYILDIGASLKQPPRTIHRPQGMNHFVLIYCLDGHSRFQKTDQSWIEIEKNTAVLIHPGIPYRYSWDLMDPWSYFFVHFCGAHASTYLQGCPAIHRVQPQGLFMECRQLVRKCHDILVGDVSMNSMVYCSHLLGQLLTLLLLPPMQYKKDQGVVQSAIHYMMEHLERSITLQQLSEWTHLSPSHLIKRFRQQTGMSPIEYFLFLKIEAACKYLDHTELTVKEIAYRLGFSDPYYFSRQFAKTMNISPTQYRKRHL